MSVDYNTAMLTSGSGIFFDGLTSARHPVSIELESASLLVRGPQGHPLTRWPYSELEHLSAPEGMLRLGRRGNSVLARLEIRDSRLAAAIDELATTVDRTGTIERRSRTRVVAWTLAAVLSLVLAGVFGVPAIADRLTPYVPSAVERKFGEAVDAQVRATLDTRRTGSALVCGAAEGEREGRAALDRLLGQIEAAAALSIPIELAVMRQSQPNAFALPGGRVYVFEGLINKAQSADELAAVIAHELGHVAHRDSTRSVIQAAGLSFLFGMVLGDFVGGGAVVMASKTLLQTSYSREVERRADAYGVDLVTRIGGNSHALGDILERIEGSNHPGMKLLLDHPDTRDRLAAIKTAAPATEPRALLRPAEWAALKRICAGR